jgi:general stress protein 26
MTTNQEQHLFEIIDQLKVAMLVTHGEGGLHARPLHLVERDEDGTLWFFTSLSSGKIAEMNANPEVALTFQGEHRFVSVSGVARIERDPETLRRLFRESFRPWFPDGAADPEAAGVGITPHSAEFWDLAGVRGVRYVFNAVTAVATGRRAADAPSADYHGLVSFDPDKV